MHSAVPLACFLSMIRPPGVQFENSLLQLAPVDKAKCPFVRDTNDIGFWLYTRHNPTVYQELVVDDDEKLFASNIDYHAPTVIYFHAFMENPEDGSAVRIREAYMLRGDTNVIMVDASRLEAGPWYFTAAENTWYIGKFAARFIDYLVSRGLDLSKTHLVGHSLGAQAAGVAGASLKSGRISRITGLDPALPLFAGLPAEQRLDKSDAEFVDVIHTDAGIFGVPEPVGHADFYPNGGISPQPGCELEVVIPQQQLLNKFFCSHWRSYMFYAESVLRPDAFPATSCASWRHYMKGGCKEDMAANMGFGVNTNKTKLGSYMYYLTPNKNNTLSDKNNKTSNNFLNNLNKFFEFLHILLQGNIAEKKHEKPIKKASDRTVFNKVKKTKINNEENSVKISRETALISKNKEVIYPDSFEDQMMIESLLYPYILKTNQEEQFGKNTPEQQQFNQEQKQITGEQGKLAQELEQSNQRQQQLNQEQQQLVDVQEQQNFTREQTQYTEQQQFNQEQKQLTGEQGKLAQELEQSSQGQQQLNQEQQQQVDVQEQQTFTREQKQLIHVQQQAKNHVHKRYRRFINPFRRSEAEENENFFFRILNFLLKNRKSIVPVYSVMREINTLVKSANGELNHITKERNNFIGSPPPLNPITYTLELGNESKILAFIKRLLGLAPKGDRLTINGNRK